MAETVLITGASRGIGRAAMVEFARRGCNVVGVCLNNTEKLKSAVADAKAFGVEAFAISDVDVGNYLMCREKIYDYLKENKIKIDCIINNAGVSYIGLLQDMDINQWDRIVSTNLTSVFNMSKLFIPDFVSKKRGNIVNVSSVWGSVGASCETAYSATKGGINSFTKALAKELAPSGIRVNAVAFGAVDTEMNGFLSGEERAALEGEIPLGRMGYVEEAAKMLADVVNGPQYLTGQIITMDGGWM